MSLGRGFITRPRGMTPCWDWKRVKDSNRRDSVNADPDGTFPTRSEDLWRALCPPARGSHHFSLSERVEPADQAGTDLAPWCRVESRREPHIRPGGTDMAIIKGTTVLGIFDDQGHALN